MREDLKERKKEIRKDLLKQRKGLSENFVVSNSHLISERLERLTKKKGFSELFYYPIHHEVNLLDLASKRLKANRPVFFPRVMGERSMLAFRVLDLKKDLERGAFHLWEPRLNLKSGIPDWVYVPGIAFSEGGGRIGYGKGFYDVFLSDHPQIFKIGICYDFQLLEEVPTEESDCLMDLVITEKKTLLLSERAGAFV